MFGSSQPLIILQEGVHREHGRATQLRSIEAVESIASVVKSTLGPRSMLKLVLDPLGGIVITNDGNAILREIDVIHPAAKSIIELSRAQDEEVGDGTTTVAILASEILSRAKPRLNLQVHPIHLTNGFFVALRFINKILASLAVQIDLDNDIDVLNAISSCLGTKFSENHGKFLSKLALESVRIIQDYVGENKKEIDIKRYIRIEKIPGRKVEDSIVLKGIAIEKDVTHSGMRRRIVNPRIVLLDCPLEYKKGESMTNVEIYEEDDFEKLLLQEEEEVKKMIDCLINVDCNLVITEKGVSDLAAHYLMKKNISVVRRTKKTEQNRLAKITGATIVNRCDEISCEDVGTKCKLFEVKKIDDDYWTFLVDCEDPKACTILLRGGSKDSLNEIERNLHDALAVTRNLMLNPKILPGGGATEMELSLRLAELAESEKGNNKLGIKIISEALENIPKLLISNTGVDVLIELSQLKKFHFENNKNANIGFDGISKKIVNVIEKKIWDSYVVKLQAIKTAIECSAMLLRTDDILSGISKKDPKPEVKNYGNTTH